SRVELERRPIEVRVAEEGGDVRVRGAPTERRDAPVDQPPVVEVLVTGAERRTRPHRKRERRVQAVAAEVGGVAEAARLLVHTVEPGRERRAEPLAEIDRRPLVVERAGGQGE